MYQPCTSKRSSSQKTARPATAPPSAAKLMSLVKNTAMIRIAKRSSTTASVRRKARRAEGSEVPMTARTASAKAMSVAVGTAQPPSEPPPTTLTSAYTSAGTAIPHTAAMTGSAAAFGSRSSPATISRFSSIPATKKKTAISPSAAQCWTERCRPMAPGPRWKWLTVA